MRENSMNNLWKVSGKEKVNIRYKQAEVYSPYSECCVNGVSQLNDTIVQITMNAFYRYDSIMRPLFLNESVSNDKKKWIFDVYMHYLTELECRTGITYQDFLIQKLQIDLEEGMYDIKISQCFQKLSKEEKYLVAHSLFQQRNTRETVDRFAETLVSMIQNSAVYKNELNEKQLYIYIANRENDEDSSKIYLIQQLFLPMHYEIRVFWKQHFAVLGEEKTMRMGEIELI